jgi:hypothetical protein
LTKSEQAEPLADETRQLEIRRSKAELKKVEGDISVLIQRREALKDIVAGYERLETLERLQAPVEPVQGELKGMIAQALEPSNGAPSSFINGILAVIRDLGRTRGVTLEKVASEARERGLTTSAVSFERGVLYAIAGLKRKKLVRSPKRGRYRPVEFKEGNLPA